MNGPIIVSLVLASVALLTLPRRWAAVPLLVGACYLSLGFGFSVGPFSFNTVRTLAFVGFVRVLMRGERPVGGMKALDWLMVAWAVWALMSSPFHDPPNDALVFRLGLVYNVLGIYFLIRCFCQTPEDVVHLVKITAFLLLPVALEMANELVTRRNFFNLFSGGSGAVVVREGEIRARGPFVHPILAGTVGAICLPLMVGIWRKHPLSAKVGLGACLMMVMTSNSSGPMMSAIVSAFALVFWRWRHLTRHARIAAVIAYFLLEVVMNRPAYYIITKADLTGSSTGWHRARLIEMSIRNLDEWWLAGTDYTLHWMPTGVSWSPNHTDITNYYIKMGVIGGLPLMFLLIAAFIAGFRYVGRTLESTRNSPVEDQFFVWALGCSLFCHTVSSISISYFDQSFLFVYLTLAAIGSLYASSLAQRDAEMVESVTDESFLDEERGQGELLSPHSS